MSETVSNTYQINESVVSKEDYEEIVRRLHEAEKTILESKSAKTADLISTVERLKPVRLILEFQQDE